MTQAQSLAKRASIAESAAIKRAASLCNDALAEGFNMSFAPYYNAPGMDAPPVLGCFDVRDGARFEYSARPANDRDGAWPAFPHRVFTCDGDRAALVRATVAYVVIDECDDGAPVVEKWMLRNARAYAPR